MNPPKKFKGKSVTFEQKQTLVSFMQEHPELHKGKFSPSFTAKHSKDLWTQISNELNSIVGATKDPSKWKKCWIDLKSNTKSKSSEIKKNCGKTGGGMNESEELDDLENQILAIIGEVSVNGHPNTVEPIVCFDGYNEVMGSRNMTNDLLPTPDNIVSGPNNVDNTDDLGIAEDKEATTSPTIKDTTISSQMKYSKLGILKKSIEASDKLNKISDDRTIVLKNYYDAKIELLERMTVAKEKIAAALEKKYLG